MCGTNICTSTCRLVRCGPRRERLFNGHDKYMVHRGAAATHVVRRRFICMCPISGCCMYMFSGPFRNLGKSDRHGVVRPESCTISAVRHRRPASMSRALSNRPHGPHCSSLHVAMCISPLFNSLNLPFISRALSGSPCASALRKRCTRGGRGVASPSRAPSSAPSCWAQAACSAAARQ